MNRRILISISIICITLLACSNNVLGQEDSSPSATVTRVSGEAMAQKGGASVWNPITQGDVLSGGDTIRTSPASKVRIQFPSGSIIEVNEMTSLTIRQLAAKTAKEEGAEEVFLLKGRIKAIVEKLDKKTAFEVKTPTAVAGVRGTIFYVNVVDVSERILTGQASETGLSLTCSEIIDMLLGIKDCYAQTDGLYTELFVEQGFVNFTNIFSNISYMVGANNGSFAGEGGDTGVPQFVPQNKRQQWQSGFGFQAGKGTTGGPTKKGLKSTTGGPPGGGPPGGGPDDPPFNPDPTGPTDPNRPPGGGSTSSIIDIQTRRELDEELVDLHNDIADITDRIDLAGLDARLTEIQDAQDGKVMRDRFGNFVRSDSYVLKPADNKVAILHLVHRRTGDHSGVSSTALELTFDQSLAGANLKNDIPWAEIFDSSSATDPISYSSLPTYYLKPNNANFDPSSEHASMILTFRNPSGDYNSIYEGFGSLTQTAGIVGWYQSSISPLYNMNINGTLKNVGYGAGWAGVGGTGGFTQTFTDGTFYTITGHVIDNDGNVQLADTFTDGTSQNLEINSIRSIYKPKRENNLEFNIEASEFNGGVIDTIVAPEVTRPYTED